MRTFKVWENHGDEVEVAVDEGGSGIRDVKLANGHNMNLEMLDDVFSQHNVYNLHTNVLVDGDLQHEYAWSGQGSL